jgi:hypothetical protein
MDHHDGLRVVGLGDLCLLGLQAGVFIIGKYRYDNSIITRHWIDEHN